MDQADQTTKLAAAKRTLKFWRRHKAVPKPETVVPESASARMPIIVRKENRDYAFTEWILWLLRFSLAVNIALMPVLVGAYYMAGQKSAIQVRAPSTLRALSDEYFRTEGIRFDHVALTIVSILPLLHHIDQDGAPLFVVLQGVVSPKIYRAADAGFKKAIAEVKRSMVIQNLNITSITDYESDAKTGRVSCYVRGYFSVIIQQTGRSTIIPYRAEVLLEQNTIGNLNPLPFTLIDRTEKLGANALAWDAERAASRKKP